MKPYFTNDLVTLYCGDCRAILPDISEHDVDLLITDPPYGIALNTKNRARRRGAITNANDFPEVIGDDVPFDPTHLLRFPRLILFGANNYADKLPPSQSWIVWDKNAGMTSKREMGFNDGADAELAWSNLGGTVRVIHHRWQGMLKDSEKREQRLHPTQKPIVVMAYLIHRWTKPGDVILDPYAGSGSTLIAAAKSGRRAIGIEISEDYCRIMAQRLQPCAD